MAITILNTTPVVELVLTPEQKEAMAKIKGWVSHCVYGYIKAATMLPGEIPLQPTHDEVQRVYQGDPMFYATINMIMSHVIDEIGPFLTIPPYEE